MEKFIEKKITVPLVYVQRVKTLQKTSPYTKAVHEDVGSPIGPFYTATEAGRAVGMTKNFSHVSSVLSGKLPTISGYRFYYKGEKELMFKIPNVKFAKQNDLLLNVKQHTIETIEQNIKICGFDIVEIGEFKKGFTKIIVKCCNVECDNTVEKRYTNFISLEELPYCKKCSTIVKSIKNPNKQGEKSLADVRPDLIRFYHAKDNNEIEINEISFGSNKKIYLRCDCCNKLQKENETTTANSYTFFKTNGNGFNSNFTCSYCNSLATRFPNLVKEWHEKNNKSPFDYSYGSLEKVWWKCSEGHEWTAKINSRAGQNKGCPQCSHSKGEKAIAQLLDELKIEYIAQYSVQIGGTTRFFDYYMPEEKIFVEIMGLQHYQDVDFSGKGKFTLLEKQQKIDEMKKQYALKHGSYLAIDYREHVPELAVERFIDALAKIAEHNDEIAV